MIARTFEEALTRVRSLVADFRRGEAHFLSPAYGGTKAREDFIDRFWMALGWDVTHETQKNPYEREVEVEAGLRIEGRGKRADYSFAVAPNFRDPRLLVEAKKPSRRLANAQDYFQTVRHGWHAHTPVAVLTDFEELHVLDCRRKPDIAAVLDYAALEKFHYADYADEEKFRRIYHLFSRDAVAAGALEAYAARLPKPAARRGRRAPAARGAFQSVDDAFLQDLDGCREQLARAFKRANPALDGPQLTGATQRTLDRLVLMRFLEDKLIEPDELVEPLAQSARPWADFVAASRRLDRVYDGIIFRRHAIDAPAFRADEAAFRRVCANLSHRRSVYRFDLIPIHILGSIYERFLGKTIVVTDGVVSVERKPELRHAQGVYYTPEYVVRHVVGETVGKLIEGKTPEQISALRFADIACGSGAFLLGVYDLLLRYHAAYYNRNRRTRAAGVKAGGLRQPDGTVRLSLLQKRTLLLNNVYGVDADAQAVEVAQLSLYLKLLEEETTQTAHAHQLAFREALLPSLNENIKSGNSLVGTDVARDQLSDSASGGEEELKISPMDFRDEFERVMGEGGFDAVVGNPPYIRIQTLRETSPRAVEYVKRRYASAGRGNYDLYVVFVERALDLLNARGLLGYILPHKFFNARYGRPLRELLAEGRHLSRVVHFGAQQVFAGATTYTCLLFLSKAPAEEFRFLKVDDLEAWRERGEAVEGVLPAACVTADEWNFAVGEGADLCAKLAATPVKLGDVADIFVGLQTSADDVYIMDFVAEGADTIRLRSKALGGEWTFEKALLSPLVSGTDVKRYDDLPARQFILFPYEVEDEVPRLLALDEIASRHPRTAAYLLENRERLEGRERGKFRGPGWHRFGRSQNVGIQRRVKLCVPRLVESLHAASDADGAHFLDNVDVGGITLKEVHRGQGLEYLHGLLNSKLMRWYFPSVSAPFRGGWLSANRQFLARLPFRVVDFDDPGDRRRHGELSQLVGRMLAARRQLKGARAGAERGVFGRKCAAIDRRLDALVYELYGLTETERALVEGGSR